MSADLAVVREAKLDTEDGVLVYEIEFEAGGYEYEYDIDAASGAVVKFEKERDDDDAPSQGGNPGSAPAGDIGEARAKEAAMSHAGVAEADIRDYKIERDTDDGIGVYEIEFKVGGYEYDYEVKAADGAILKNQKEIDD